LTSLEVLGDLTDEALERELPDKQFGRLLVPPNLTKSHGTRTEPVRLLHTTSGSLANNDYLSPCCAEK